VARAQSPGGLLPRLERCRQGFVHELDYAVSELEPGLGAHVICIFLSDDAVVWEGVAEDGVHDGLSREIAHWGSTSIEQNLKNSKGNDTPVTGLLSSLVNVSFLTSLLKTDAVSEHARRTAAIATCFSAAYVDILEEKDKWV
jgi:hypothetical protein